MVDFARLRSNWHQWAPGMSSGGISVSTTCDDCQILFRSNDHSVHLHYNEPWWIVDIEDDRGQRRESAAKFSNFDLAQKYLIWDWATTARTSLASGPLGTDLAKQGYAAGVRVSQVSKGWEICSDEDCAVLSVVNATIFSHLMSKSVDEIERLVNA